MEQAPADTPWGERDACILEPDGYRIHITQSKSGTWLESAEDGSTDLARTD